MLVTFAAGFTSECDGNFICQCKMLNGIINMQSI